jgi:hypothetical protein
MLDIDFETTKLRAQVTPSESYEAIFFREKASEYYHEIRDLQRLAVGKEFMGALYVLDEHGPLVEPQTVIMGPEPFKWNKTPPLFTAERRGSEVIKGAPLPFDPIALGSLYVRLWNKD